MMANIPMRHLADSLGAFSIHDVTENRTFFGYRVQAFSDERHFIPIPGGQRVERRIEITVENNRARPLDESILARMHYELECYAPYAKVKLSATDTIDLADLMRKHDAHYL
jgi:hypothetical protein